VCGYLLSGKYQGLTENEILGLLAFDKEYWNHFVALCHPDHRDEVGRIGKLPMVVWSRLFLDLEPYLTEREADGLSILSFYHRKFMECVATRYVPAHPILANYFEREPLYADEREERPNVRKVAEQPYQQTLSAQWHNSVDQSLANFSFLMAKAKASMVDGILEDYQLTFTHAPQETKTSLRLWEAFFRERGHILRRGNEQWPAFKILLQLAVEHADDSPVTMAAEQYLDEGKVDWVWMRRMQRVKEAGVSPCLAVFEGHTSGVDGALQLTDGHILSWSRDKTLRIWDTDGRSLTILEGHTDSVWGALQLIDGRILSRASDKTLRIWDINGRPLTALEGHTSAVDGTLQLTDGHILSWSRDKTLRIWESGGRPLMVLEGHTSGVDGALQLTDGRILSWSSDKTLRVWGTDGSPLAVLEGHTGFVSGALQLSDGRILSWQRNPPLSMLEDDKTLRLWDTDGGLCAILAGHTSNVSGALQLTDGRILSWSEDKTLCIWDTDGGRLAVLEGHTDYISGAIQLADGRIFSWSGYDKTLRIWDTEGRPITALARDKSYLGLLIWDVDGRPFVFEGHGALQLTDGRILSWSPLDDTLRIWDADRRALAVPEGHIGCVRGALQLTDGRILSWSLEKTLRIWNTEGRLSTVLEEHKDSADGALQLNDGRILSWSRDKTLRFWDTDGHLLAILEGHTNYVSSALQLRDGRILSCSMDKTLRLWDTCGRLLAVLEGHTDLVNGALQLADGRILSYSADATLRTWDTDGRLLAVLEGHRDSVEGALQLTDGRVLSWSRDKTLRIWGAEGRPPIVLAGHQYFVKGAFQFADGEILSWTSDKTLRIWDSKTGACHEIMDFNRFRIRYPESIPLYLGKNVCSHSLFAKAEGRYGEINLPVRGKGIILCVRWHADYGCATRFLNPDGILILSQDNGQVCFLQLYQGSNRISLNVMKELLRSMVAEAAHQSPDLTKDDRRRLPHPEEEQEAIDLALSMNKQATELKKSGKFEEAEALYRRVLGIREKVLGPEHPDTANSFNNLAVLLRNKGDYDSAEPLYRKALAICEKALGPRHANTISVRYNLFRLFEKMGKNEEARILRKRLLSAEDSRADAPPLTLRQRALESFQLGNYTEAEELLLRILGQNFEVSGTCCHLARIDLITEEFEQARRHVAQAWANGAEAPPYVIPRILWLQLALALLDREEEGKARMKNVVRVLGKLKTALQNDVAFLGWTMEPVLDHLRSKLETQNLDLLTALVAALGDRTKVEKLDAFPVWREAVPYPIEMDEPI
jgi:WD40 repeat protein